MITIANESQRIVIGKKTIDLMEEEKNYITGHLIAVRKNYSELVHLQQWLDKLENLEKEALKSLNSGPNDRTEKFEKEIEKELVDFEKFVDKIRAQDRVIKNLGKIVTDINNIYIVGQIGL